MSRHIALSAALLVIAVIAGRLKKAEPNRGSSPAPRRAVLMNAAVYAATPEAVKAPANDSCAPDGYWAAWAESAAH